MVAPCRMEQSQWKVVCLCRVVGNQDNQMCVYSNCKGVGFVLVLCNIKVINSHTGLGKCTAQSTNENISGGGLVVVSAQVNQRKRGRVGLWLCSAQVNQKKRTVWACGLCSAQNMTGYR